MPPHHHHHHGGGFLPAVYPFYAGGYDLTPSQDVYIVNAPDRPTTAEIMAFIKSLPKAQRAAAYRKFFGVAAPAGALAGISDVFGSLTTTKIFGIAAVVVAGAIIIKRMGRRANPRRRRRRR